MPVVTVVHWEEGEARRLCSGLRPLGFKSESHPGDAGKLLGILKANPPGAIIIDLGRSPAQGRDLGVALRIFSKTRRVPLLFVGGKADKVEKVRQVLPDAVFTSWEEIEGPLRDSLANPLHDPVVPDSALAGYSGTPLPKKLGIKAGSRVLLARAPQNFAETLNPLPEGVRFLTRYGAGVDLILWFVRTEGELKAGIEMWADRVGQGGIWILWEKKGSESYAGLSQARVRRVGLDTGLVDYKIAAVDDRWSGLKFALRKKR